MTRQEKFEAYFIASRDLELESLEQYRFSTIEGYRLPDLARAYRDFCAGMGAVVWSPIETCPQYDEVLFYREDCGVLLGRFCDRDMLMTDKERDEWDGTEDQLYDPEYWAFGQWGVELLDGSEAPTHWMPLPAGPEVAP